MVAILNIWWMWKKIYDTVNYWLVFTNNLAVFQLYCGMNKFYILDTYKTLRNKRYFVYKTIGLYVQIKETLKG
jgi:hypothetical protein